MSIQEKIIQHFDGRVVRKDLTKEVKGNAVVPTYVLEYLLGQHCASFDEEVISQGLEKVKLIIRDHFVHRDQAEFVKSTIREKSKTGKTHRIIDKVYVRLNDKKDVYEANFTNLKTRNVLIGADVIKQHPKLLSSGVWCLVNMNYIPDEEGQSVPWAIEDIKPIQISGIDLESYIEARKNFTKEEWIDLLMQSIGLNPSEFTYRTKLIQLTRLIPYCENNYNLIELGPKGTGKSHIFSELSPHGILVSGGDVTSAKLFVNNTSGDMGLVGYWDTVAFDEFAGHTKRVDKTLVDIMKNYMANKSFSRGGQPYGATASMAFIGNTEHSVPYMLKNSDLFEALPKGYHDSAFLDRLHAYLPGWEINRLKSDMFTDGYGFIVDYLAEILKSLRNDDFSPQIKQYFTLDSSFSSRDTTAIYKSFSGLAKIIYPHGEMTKDEVEELLKLTIEYRKRVSDEIVKIDDVFEKVNFSYSDDSNKKVTVETLEWKNFNIKKEDPEEEEEQAPTSPAQAPIHLEGGHHEYEDNSTGISYKKLFGPYLKGAKNITLNDAYIRMPYQFKNLVEFCVMLAKQKPIDEEINLEVVTWNKEGYREKSEDIFNEIIPDVQQLGINMSYRFEDIHARSIIADTGWKISLDRGLDIFQEPSGFFSVENVDQEQRLIRKFEITYLRI